MNRLTSLYVLIAFCFSVLSAGSPDKLAGTKTSTTVVNGKVMQKSETIAEPNPLPSAQNILEQEKSQPIPNSGLYSTNIRWISTDTIAIGQDVSVNSGGTNTFVGWNLNSERVSFHDNSSATPLWEYLSDPETYRNFVALSATANIVANASYHNIYLFDKTSGTVSFNFPIPTARIAGMIAVSRDGQLLVCATSSPLSGGMHRVYAFNPPSTTPVWTFDFSDAQSTGIYGVNISVDKSTVAVNTKFYAWILNANTGTVRTQFEIANTESRVALSSDASVMAIAELSGFVKAYLYNTSQSRYDLLWQYRIPPGVFTNWASAVEVSADGLTIMAGSLIFLSAGYDGTAYLFDTFGEGAPNWIKTGLGDEVGMVALSDDGSLGAVATWGDFNNPSKPTILIFERGSNQPIFQVASPGSIFSIAMSADGKTVAAGGKHVHARMFGNGGDVYNIAVDLGGGAIAGSVILGGVPPNHSGTLVQVLGTTRSATTLPSGQYLVPNIPPGTYTVRMSRVGYVGTTINSITVTGTDTTRNVNATLPQAGAAPTNLVASHSQNSRIQLNWTNPTLFELRPFDRLRATDEITTVPSVSLSARKPGVRSGHASIQQSTNPTALSDLVPPDSIKVYRAIRTGGPYYLKRVLTGAPSTYVDSSAMPLKNYYYRVTAIYGNGESAYSNEANGTVDSSFLQFAFTTPHRTSTPTIDGTISAGEWTDAIKIDVSDVFGYGGGIQLPRGSVFMWFKYDSLANRLYIAGEDILNNDGLVDNEGFGLYFDDNHNRQFEPIGGDSLLREGNYWGYYFSAGPNVRFRVIYTGGGVGGTEVVTDAQVAFSGATGHVTGEVSIPLGFFNRNHLQVYGPDRIVGAGLFMIGRASDNAAIFHGWWPQTMASVFTPSGFGDIHIPIRLPGEPVSVGEGTETPKEFALLQNYPNPFNPTTSISFTIPHSSFITLKVYDILGREVATLVNEQKPPGSHSVAWDAGGIASGVYIYRLTVGGFSAVRRMILIR